MVLGFLGVTALHMVSLPLTLAASILLARMLGAEEFGRYAFVTSLAALMSLPVGHGIAKLLTREISSGVKEDWLGVHSGIMRWAWRRLVVYAIGIVAVAMVAWLAMRDARSATSLAAALLAPIVAGYQVFGGAIRGHGAVFWSQVPEMLIRTLGFLILICTAWALSALNLTTALLAQLIGASVGLALSWWILKRIAPPKVSSVAPISDLARWNRASVLFMLITAAEFASVQVGILGLGLMDMPAEAAGMRIAQSGAQFVMLSIVAVDLVTQSKIAVLARKVGSPALHRTYVRAAQLAFGASILVGMPLIVVPDLLVRVTFGEDFVALTKGPIILLAIMQIVNAAFGASGTLLNMSGHEKQALLAQIASILVTVPGVFVFGALYGANGAAAALLAGMVIKKLTEACYVRLSQGIWLHALSW